jgi:hypothetical protein
MLNTSIKDAVSIWLVYTLIQKIGYYYLREGIEILFLAVFFTAKKIVTDSLTFGHAQKLIGYTQNV